jgi:hypothetical protein
MRVDSAFWREMAARFRRISAPNLSAAYCSRGWSPASNTRSDADTRLDAGAITIAVNHETHEPPLPALDLRWTLVDALPDGTPVTSPEIHRAFRDAARLVAVALGFPNTDDAWLHWLDALQVEGQALSEIFDGEAVSADARVEENGPDRECFILGQIDHLVDVSARFCESLEAETLTDAISTTAGVPDFSVRADDGEQLARERQAVVTPVLRQRRWSASRWAENAGVDKSVALGYLSGTSTPHEENRKALAQAIGLPLNRLPF